MWRRRKNKKERGGDQWGKIKILEKERLQTKGGEGLGGNKKIEEEKIKLWRRENNKVMEEEGNKNERGEG